MVIKMLVNGNRNNRRSNRRQPKLRINQREFRKISGPNPAGNLTSFYDRILEADCADFVASRMPVITAVEQKPEQS